MLLLVFCYLFLQIFGEFLRPLVQRVVVPQIFVHRISSVVELRLELLAVRFGFGGFGRQRFLFTGPSLEQLQSVLELLVEALFAALASLDLGRSRREALFEIRLVAS